MAEPLVGQFPLEQWFFEMPFCTRWWTTGVVLTSVLVQCHVISPFNMFYSINAIFNKGQVGISLSFITWSNLRVVLAISLVVILLWTARSRSTLPRLLPPTVFAPARRVVWSVSCTLLLAPGLLCLSPSHHRADAAHLLPRHGSQ